MRGLREGSAPAPGRMAAHKPMRVITGTARGRKLATPKGETTRPTTDRTKESIFNSIQFDIEGRRVLDLFAGTGQMGIEALSRGAADAVFVDAQTDCVKLVRENLRRTGFEERAHVVGTDYRRYIAGAPRVGFGLIFVDPPYGTGMLPDALTRIFEADLLVPGGLIVCEAVKDEVLPAPRLPYVEGRQYIYGKSRIQIYIKTAPGTE